MPALAGVLLRRLRDGRTGLILLSVLLFAAALRWNGLDWDQGRLFHPDERHILMVSAGLALPLPPDWSLLLSAKSPLNPHSFAYGSLPFYLLKATSLLLAWIGGLAPFLAPLRPFGDFDHLRLVGRALAGLFDLGSVALVYLIGRRFWDRRVGLLGAALLAITVINVQYAHFYATDTLLTFFVLAATLFNGEVLRSDRLRPAILAGIATGLAIGTKFSATPVLAMLVGAHLLRLFFAPSPERERGGREWSSAEDEGARRAPLRSPQSGAQDQRGQDGLRPRVPGAGELNRGALALLASLGVAAATFLLVEPYAVIDFTTFAKNLAEQNDMVRGVADLPYTRQYANTPAYWYFVWNLLVWGMGLPLGLIVLAGTLGAAAQALRRPTQPLLLLMLWALPYFAITGSFHAKFLRYLIPLTPFLCLLAAYAIFRLRDQGTGTHRDGQDRQDEADFTAETAENAERIGGTGTETHRDRQDRQDEADFTAETAENAERIGGTGTETHRDGQDRQDGTGTGLTVESAESGKWTGLGTEIRQGHSQIQPSLPPRSWRSPQLVRLLDAAIVVAIAGGVLYALAFSSIYGQKHTAVRGSEWIYQNVPRGATLLTEHWEEGMPVSATLNGTVYDAGRMGYRTVSFEGYQPDNPAKIDHIVQRLGEADYIVFFSNRLYGTIPRLPERYPITSRYYELLFGEQLGFRLVAHFTSYPSILGLTLVEDTFGDPRLPVPAELASFRPTPLTIVPGKADESFSVYDHPKVLIFKKERSLAGAELRALFGPTLAPARGTGIPPAAVLPTQPEPTKSLLLDEAQRLAVAAGGTFRALFDRDGIGNRLPVPVWVALVELIGLLGLPLAFVVFRRLPDRGYLLAKPLGILALAWIDWMLVSLGLLRNTRTAAALALLLLAVISAYFARRHWPELREYWRERQRHIIACEVLFWSAFALFLAIRLANPDLWHPARGGEKPMDLAYLMAAIKSATFPPYDPWFAGGYLNYYYYGQIVVGTLVKLSGIVPTTAYNLVVPLLFALTAGGAFSAGYNLLARGDGIQRGDGIHRDGQDRQDGAGDRAHRGEHGGGLGDGIHRDGQDRQDGTGLTAEGAERRRGGQRFAATAADSERDAGRPGQQLPTPRVERPWLVGIGAAAVAVLFGNLGGATQLIEQIMRVGPPPIRSSLLGVEGVATFLAGLWRLVVERRPLPIGTDWFWASTRVLEGTINEFPFFTFLFADLHAHMIALPLTMLALGLAINVIKGGFSEGSRRGRPRDAAISLRSGRWRIRIHDLFARAESRGTPHPSPLHRDGEGTDRDGEGTDAGNPRCENRSQALRMATSGSVPRFRDALYGVPEAVLGVVGTALVIGALLPTNSWDFPTYLVLYAAALLVVWYVRRPPWSPSAERYAGRSESRPDLSAEDDGGDLRAGTAQASVPRAEGDFGDGGGQAPAPQADVRDGGGAHEARFAQAPAPRTEGAARVGDRWECARGLAGVALKVAGIVLLSYALYWPFHANFQQWYLGVDPIKDKSNVWGYLRIHGFFLFAIASFLVTETARRHGRSGLLRSIGLWLRHWDDIPRVHTLRRRLVKREGRGHLVAYGIAAALAILVIVHLMGMTLVALLLGLLVWTATLALPRDNPPERTFLLVLVAAGLALSALVELVAIKGDIGRMNTVFKFYLQVWMLWSVAAVACLYLAARHIRARWPFARRELWRGMAVLLVAASLVYPMIAARARVSDRFDNGVPLTLDGTAYMLTATFRERNPDTKQESELRLGADLPAMRWLQDNVEGTPVILEGWAPLYHWGARYSIYTGLPTVIGWDWHQKQQRWGYQAEVDRRVGEVRTIYGDSSVERAVALMEKYGVRYVIVGGLERVVYPAAGLAKFDRMVGQQLELVYDSQGVKIYRRL